MRLTLEVSGVTTRSEATQAACPLDRKVSPLPCPHCGSDDLNGPHLTEYIGDTRYPHWWIECKKCPCGMQVDGESNQPLIEAWNKRANVQGQGEDTSAACGRSPAP